MDEKKRFISILQRAQETFLSDAERLAGEGWDEPWQTLIATIISAQNRDTVTIPAAESLFDTYTTINELADAEVEDVASILDSVNYYKTKAKHVVKTARKLVHEHDGHVPASMEELLELPGVGRKTANLVITEEFDKDGICVDTHVHRISNVLGFVDTDSPEETEAALRELVPRKYWSDINRAFVLWGQAEPSRDADELLDALE